MARCRTKRCCWAKSSPPPVAAATENTYNVEPGGVGPSTGVLNGPAMTPSAAVWSGSGRVPAEGHYEDIILSPADVAVYYDSVRNADHPPNGSRPQPHPVPHAHVLGPDAQRHDSGGTTLVDNALYGRQAKSPPGGEPLYVNAAFHATD